MTNELYEKHCWALVDLDAMQSNLALIKKTVGAPVRIWNDLEET